MSFNWKEIISSDWNETKNISQCFKHVSNYFNLILFNLSLELLLWLLLFFSFSSTAFSSTFSSFAFLKVASSMPSISKSSAILIIYNTVCSLLGILYMLELLSLKFERYAKLHVLLICTYIPCCFWILWVFHIECARKLSSW